MPKPSSKVHKVSVKTNESRQLDKNKNQVYAVPPIDLATLIMAYENSFMLGGIIERIATSAGVGWKETDNKDLDALLAKIDIEEMVKSFLVTGNFFLEMAFSLGNKLSLFSFISGEIRMKNDYTIVQETAFGNAEFLKGQYIHVKRSSLSSRYWGESLVGRAVQQIILLQNIDKFYAKLFERGLLQAFLLTDKSGLLDDSSKQAIDAIIKDVFSGVDNAFNTGVVSADLWKIDLTSGVDNQYYIELRKQAEKDIAIAMNFPYDLLNSENSNRSISEVSLESLNLYITKPNLTRIANQLKEPLRQYFGNAVDNIAFNDLDISNQKEEMEVNTGYLREWAWTANEVREATGKSPHADGDKLGVRVPTPHDSTEAIKQAIATGVQKMYKKI